MDRSLKPVLVIEAYWLCINCQRALRFRLDAKEPSFRAGCQCGETYILSHETSVQGEALVEHCEKP